MSEFASEYYWTIIASSFFLAGIVKGTLGLGLPTTAITILTFFLPFRCGDDKRYPCFNFE